MERHFNKGWSSETWPNHFANQTQESRSSRKHESHLGKNERSTKPIRLRFLVPELYEAPLEEEENGELNKSHIEDDLSDDIATALLSAPEENDSIGESSEDSYVGSSERNMVSTSLCSVPEEVTETDTLVRSSGYKKAPDKVDLCSNVFERSCNRSVSQTHNRSRFAEVLQNLEIDGFPHTTPSGVISCNLKDITKVDCNGSNINNFHCTNPFSVQEPNKNGYLVNSVNKKRLVLQEIDHSPFINSGWLKSDSNGSLHTNANKENECCNFVKKLSVKSSEGTKSIPLYSCNDKMILSKNGLGNKEVHYERKNYAYSMPVRRTEEMLFGSSLNFSREELGDYTKGLKKCETKEKGIQCGNEKFVEVVGCEVYDKAVQCVVEKADKCVMAELRPKQEGNAQGSLIVKGKFYNVLSKLGSGGSSSVYQVLDPSTSSLFAVKCVRLPAEQEAVMKGYINEINLLKKLQGNDCVITLHEFEHIPEKEILYVVMEKGDTDLSKLIRDYSSKRRTLSVPMIVYYWTEMLNAVKYIHDHGIIHSDLKPANFLLVRGRLKLIDFGIASSLQSDMTSIFRDTPTGTLNYMSPEAVTSFNSNSPSSKNKYKVSYKSDVWSLGCILYSLIYGKTPFHDIGSMYLKVVAITNPATKISFPANERCPKILIDTLKQCLLFDSKKRPTTAELLAVPYIHGGASIV